MLLTMGAISNERRRGTLAFVLTKPVQRRAFLLAKLAVGSLIYSTGTLVAALGCLVYSRILFGEVDLVGYLAINGLILLTFLVYLALTMLASVALPSAAAAAGVGVGAFLLFSMLGGLGALGRLTPGALFPRAVDLILGRDPTGVMTTVVASLVLLLVVVVAAERLFASQEL